LLRNYAAMKIPVKERKKLIKAERATGYWRRKEQDCEK
jgi:hypothetical protein